ncbi:MAG: bifunctional oligoribonuclease/PAP phosphatase NrnA [Deltaproteobacteria bacterium]|nr:bifunctional oligoribonuclease/PAP phosphatase NrnA [Deltaproteobacteria bacterium]
MEPPGLQECARRALPKLERLRELVRGKRTLLAQTHDYPDPDAIASALGLTWLLEELEGLETTIGYGGIIGRAENRAMIKSLGIKLRKVSPADFKKNELVALLDTQPGVGNHSLPADVVPNIVFDHHFERELAGAEPEYFDVGGEYGATSTKVLEIIWASGLTPPTHIATALFYGVKTDTLGLGRVVSPADVTAYLYLFPLADKFLLAEIENPQVPLDYFRVFYTAILRGKIYGNMVVADLGEIYTPDLCAEVADRLLQVEGIRHALSLGWYEDALFLSLRTRSRNKNAGRILHSIVCCGAKTLGTAGGHGPMAGARVPVEGRSQRTKADLRRTIVQAILEAFGQDPRRFTRIISLREAMGDAVPGETRATSKTRKGSSSGTANASGSSNSGSGNSGSSNSGSSNSNTSDGRDTDASGADDRARESTRSTRANGSSEGSVSTTKRSSGDDRQSGVNQEPSTDGGDAPAKDRVARRRAKSEPRGEPRPSTAK